MASRVMRLAASTTRYLANDVAKRFTRELNQMGICQAVVPVSDFLR